MKLKKPKKKIIVIILITLISLISLGVFYLLFLRESPEEKWYDSNWSYRRSIHLKIPREYRGKTEDVLIEIDTASMIVEGKLAEDCKDIRLVDENNSTTLKYWIEGGCNTEETQIWTNVNLPSSSEVTFYMYYGNELAVDNQENWEGVFFTMQEEPCFSTCEETTNFNGRFIKGGQDHGTLDGQDLHSHTMFDFEDTQNCINRVNIAAPENNTTCDVDEDNIINFKSSEVNNIPEHKDLYFCKYLDGFLPPDSIILFDKRAPETWSTYTPLIGKYPRGEDGSDIQVLNSHTHYPSCTNGDFEQKNGTEQYLSLTGQSRTIPIPLELQYFNVNYIISPNSGTIPSEGIMMLSKLPPLGWKQYEELDGYFPKGSAANFKETGGDKNHFHVANFSTIVKNTTREKLNTVETTMACINNNFQTTFQTNEESVLPTHLNILFGKKKTGLVGKLAIEIGDEVNQNFEILGTSTTTPSKPTDLKTEGQTNPTSINSLTPAFTAIFNHPDYP